MVKPHILTVLSILPLSFATVATVATLDNTDSHNGLSPESVHHAATRQAVDMPERAITRDRGHGEQLIRKASARKRSVERRRRSTPPPFVGVGGVELDLVGREDRGMVKRSDNGTLLPLGTSQK